MGVKVRERPRDSGTWWVFVDYQGRRKAKKCGSKKMADKVSEIVSAQIALGKPLLGEEKKDLKVPTLEEYYQKFKATYMENTLKPATFKSYEASFRLHLLPELGSKRLDVIDRSLMEEFVSGLVKKKVSSRSGKTLSKDSIRLVLAALCILYQQAIEHQVVKENPAIRLGKFYRQAPKRHEDISPLTVEESHVFLRAVQEHAPEHFPLFLCALHTGMRSGELAGLQWGDVDWNEKTIYVGRQFVRGQVTTLKTKNGLRDVDASDALIKHLAALRKIEQEKWLRKGQNEVPEWVFANSRGGPADMQNWKRRYFKRAIRKAGMRDFRFHDLRHTFASQLLAQGEPVTYVSNQLGHANPQITLKVYARWVPNRSQRRGVNRLPSLGSEPFEVAI